MVKCLVILGLFSAMAMTKENKPKQEQATLKISHQMAKDAMESKIRAKVSKASFFPTKQLLKIPVKCPTSFFEYMRLQAGMLGGDHAIQVSLKGDWSVFSNSI